MSHVDARIACRLCGEQLSVSFCDLGMSPLANSYIEASRSLEPEMFHPLHAYVCSQCLLVQLPAATSASEIFSEYAYFSSVSSSWLDHARRYVDRMIDELEIGPGSQVIEIASNDGYLLQYFAQAGIDVLGIEPAANVAAAAIARRIPTEVRFFGTATARDLVAAGRRADLLIGNNVLAHVPDLNDFVAGMKALLAPDGVITMEFPHLGQLFVHNQFDTIYHEHFSYFSLLTAERTFARHGLRVFDVERLETHGGSLRVFVCHNEQATRHTRPSVAALSDEERALGLHEIGGHAGFEPRVQRTKHDLLRFLINARRAGARVVGYGAPAKGNTLLNYCGVGTDLLEFTVDKSLHKQGRLLPGTRIPVMAPDAIASARPDYVLILPWNLRDEIIAEMSGIGAWGGRFVLPIPEIVVLD